MAQHVDTIIAQRRVIRQAVKSLKPTVASLAATKDGGAQQRSPPVAVKLTAPSPDLVDQLSAVQASVEQLTASSSSILQVGSREIKEKIYKNTTPSLIVDCCIISSHEYSFFYFFINA